MAVLAAAAAGVALAVAAILIPSSAIERFALGSESGALSWGPGLFRLLLFFHGASLVCLAIVLARRPVDTQRSVPAASAQAEASAGIWAFVGLLTAVALALRLWQLNTDLWLDEVLTLTDFLRHPLPEVVAVFPSQNQHPLYSVLGRISVVLFGESAWAARLPAVFFGVTTIPILFVLGRRVAGTTEALLASALMTVSYHHVWFSQNARGYSGLLFFSVLATWLWIEALARGRARYWAAYAAAVALGLWIHMTMIFVVAAHGIIFLALVAMPQRTSGLISNGTLDVGFRWKAVVSWFFAASLALQLHALALPEFLDTALHEVSLDSEWVDPMWVVREGLQRLADGGFASLLVLGGVLTLVWGAASIWARSWTTAAALILPGPLGGLLMLALGHNLWPRFFFFCMGFLLILAIRGVVAVPAWLLPAVGGARGARLAAPAGIAACLFVIALSALTVPRAYLPKQDFTGARAYVEQVRQPGDEVVVVGLASSVYNRLYAPEWTVVEDTDTLKALQQRGRDVWLVYTLPVHMRAWLPEVWAVIQEEYDVVQIFPGTLGDGDVVVCRWAGGRPS